MKKISKYWSISIPVVMLSISCLKKMYKMMENASSKGSIFQAPCTKAACIRSGHQKQSKEARGTAPVYKISSP